MGLFKRKRRTRLVSAVLVTREWSSESGLVEHEASLANLSELLESCLDGKAPVPERVVLTGLTGTDRDGRRHSVSFTFASASTRGT